MTHHPRPGSSPGLRSTIAAAAAITTVLLTSPAPVSAAARLLDPEAVLATASATPSSPVPYCFMGRPDWLVELYGDPACRHNTP